jgi:hypothetical protein
LRAWIPRRAVPDRATATSCRRAPLDDVEHRAGGRRLALCFLFWSCFGFLASRPPLFLPAIAIPARSYCVGACGSAVGSQEWWAYGPTGRTCSPCSSPDQIATINPESRRCSEFRACCSQLQSSRAWPRRRTCRPRDHPPRRLNYFQSFRPVGESIPGTPVLYPLLATDSSTTTAPHQLLSRICLVDRRAGSIDRPCRAYPTVCPGRSLPDSCLR